MDYEQRKIVQRSSPGSWLLIFVILACTLTIVLKFGLPKTSGDVQSLFPRASDALTDLHTIEKLFGSNEIDLLLVPIETPLTAEKREELVTLEEKLQEIPEISSFHSPLKALQSIELPVRLISPNQRWARFILEIPSTLSDPEKRSLNTQIEKLRPKGGIRSGSFYASQIATSTLEKENQIRAPLCLLAIFLLLFFWTRSALNAFKILIPSFLTICCVASGLTLFDLPLGAIAQLVPPLLLAIGTSYSTYLASRLMTAPEGSNGLDGAKSSLFLASLTTVIGFLALVLMDCQGVDEFAIIMTLGTIVSAILSWQLIPWLMTGCRVVNGQNLQWLFSSKLGLTLSVILLLASGGILSLRVDTVPLDFFADNSKEKGEILNAEKIFPGSHVLNIAVEFSEIIGEPQLETIKKIEEQVRKIPGAVNVFGAPEFAKLNQALKEKDLSDFTLVGELGPLSVTTSDKLQTRIFVENDSDGRLLVELELKIREALKQFEGQIKNFAISSRELVISRQSTILTTGLLKSVFSTLLLVWLLLSICIKNYKISLLYLVPSILPIVGIFGAIGLTYETVNLGAAIVASCALGMISDFTFHFALVWKTLSGKKLDSALELCIPSFTITALTLIIGFSPTILSPVSPVRSFGLLFGASIFLGVYLNLSILPFLIKSLEKRSN